MFVSLFNQTIGRGSLYVPALIDPLLEASFNGVSYICGMPIVRLFTSFYVYGNHSVLIEYCNTASLSFIVYLRRVSINGHHSFVADDLE